MNTRIDAVAEAHNAMSREYDQLNDLWYPWLYSQIHTVIAEQLRRADKPEKGKSLDVGCGTGFQTFLTSHFGYDSIGIDIAGDLIELARSKKSQFCVEAMPPLFHSNIKNSWLSEHNEWLSNTARFSRSNLPLGKVEFDWGSAEEMNFSPCTFDVITSCGSVLSFIEDYPAVVNKMTEMLRPRGLLFVEVEQRYTVDLLWAIVDRLTGNRLGYRQTLGEAWKNLFANRNLQIEINYPFELQNGQEVFLPIRLFDIDHLESLWKSNGLSVISRTGVHSLTNIIPSVLLHQPEPSRLRSKLFSVFRHFEAKVGEIWPFWRLGCSVIYTLRKNND